MKAQPQNKDASKQVSQLRISATRDPRNPFTALFLHSHKHKMCKNMNSRQQQREHHH